MYSSEHLEDVINVLERHKYNYTPFSHRNGKCSINSELLLKQLKLNEEEIRNKAIDDFVEALKGKYEEEGFDKYLRVDDYYSYRDSCAMLEKYIDKIAEQMKKGEV